MNPDSKAGAVAAVGSAGAAATAQVTNGLERAKEVAGDTLRGIFGGLPWEMAGKAISDAVSGGGDAAATVLPPALDVVGVLL